MGNVLRMDKKQLIEGMVKLGWSDRRIARETKINRTTVARYRRAFQTMPQVPTGSLHYLDPTIPFVPSVDSVSLPPAAPPPRNALLLPHLVAITSRLQQGFSAQRIYQDLIEDGTYHGSYDSIKRYVRKLKKTVPHFYERLSVFPGREGQVDFSFGPLIGSGTNKKRSWLFKMTLSFSRHAYEELVYSQNVETFLRCHERAFAFFGGVPDTIKIDNLKSGVLNASLYEPILNSVYLAFSNWYAFIICPCDAYQPQQKGRVERDIAYTQNNALKGRIIATLEEGNAVLAHWNKRWASLRIHGATKRQVWSQFIEFEKPALKPLPTKPFPFFHLGTRKVDTQGHIEVAGNFYSVPHHLIGTKVTVHFNSEVVLVFLREQILCRHSVCHGRARASSLPEHRPSHRPVNLEAEEVMHLQKAKAIGHQMSKLIYQMLVQKDPGALKKVRGILFLRKSFKPEILEAAAGKALTRLSHSYLFVKAMCESLMQKKDHTEKDTLTNQHEHIRDLGEYQTHVNERMN